MFSVREKVTFTFGFFFKADLVSSLKECASTLAKVVVGKNLQCSWQNLAPKINSSQPSLHLRKKYM